MRNYKYKTEMRKARNSLIQGVAKSQGGSPMAEKVDGAGMLWNNIAFRDLQTVGNIEVKADPNTTVSKTGYPYYIINRNNRVIEANYPGTANIPGNSITRLQNSSTSKLLNVYDVATINFRVNYLYLCYKTSETTKHNNVAVNREMVKVVYEALSKAYSTMTTQLPFYVNIAEAPDAPTISGLSDDEEAIYGKMMAILHYQSVIQNAVSPLAKYIESLSLEQHVLNMSYRRESPTITALFGLLKKQAFKSTLNAIGTTLIGEYFDGDWYKQINMLANVPSRKANAIVEPLITATCTTLIPHVKLYTPSGYSANPKVAYYDSDNLKSAAGIYINPDTFTFEGTTESPVRLKFEDLIYRVNRMLDVSTMLRWARMLATNPEDVSSLTSPSAYYQQVVKLVEQINLVLTKFSISMTDVRTFLDKLHDSNMIYWKKNMVINIGKIEPFDPTFNVILHNMLSAYVGGSKEMTFDSSTQRWGIATLWNKYTGIAKFDEFSGGSFLTFGLRDLVLGDLEPTDSAMCLPVVFASELDTGYSKALITNRLGLTHTLVSDGSANVLQDYNLARLDPLNLGFKVKVPEVDITSLTFSGNEKYNCSSAILAFMGTMFGYGKVKVANNSYVSICDPDYVCFLDYQLEDVSNEMIQYCRNYAPFRVSTPDGARTIGFGSK